MASNLSKMEIISNVLDTKIKNLHPTFRLNLITELTNDPKVTSVAACKEIVYSKFITRSSLAKHAVQYWIDRGWSNDEAYVKSKENKQKNCKSVFSREFWLEKTNPATGTPYTLEEADFERNSRRPIRKEYWIKKGYSEFDAITLAGVTKTQNNKKGAVSAARSNVRRVTSKRCIEYYIARGYSESEAYTAVSNAQKLFSKKICIQKYGGIDGQIIWQQRQDRWQATLNSKSSEEKSRINKLKLFKGGSISKGEKLLVNHLITENITCVSQFAISKSETNFYVYDIVAKDKIIEYNGDYWHANPLKYIASDLITYPGGKTRLAQDIWNKDAKKIQFARDQGYQVLIVWESDFKKNQLETINKCIQFLTQ